MAFSFVAGVAAGRHSLTARVASSSRIYPTTCLHVVPRRYSSMSASSSARRRSLKRGRFTTGEDAPKKNMDPKSAPDAEDLEMLEKAMAYDHLTPTIDTWGQQIPDTLDVVLPRPFDAKLFLSSPLQAWSDFQDRIINSFKNSTAILTLSSEGARATLSSKMVVPFSDKAEVSWSRFKGALSTTSTKDSAIMAPLRAIALDAYENMNKALSAGEDKTVIEHTTASYQAQILDQSRKMKHMRKRGGRSIWTLNKLASPVQVLSVRVTQGYIAQEEPRFGNKLLVHALIKFDTEQSLEIYDEKGKALHEPVPEDEPVWISDADKKMEPWRVPAKSKRVVQYLVFEKRGWVNGPWQFREQIW